MKKYKKHVTVYRSSKDSIQTGGVGGKRRDCNNVVVIKTITNFLSFIQKNKKLTQLKYKKNKSAKGNFITKCDILINQPNITTKITSNYLQMMR